MPEQRQGTDSPADWVADYVRRYLETDGAEGHEWNGVPVLVLTTIERATGRAQRTPLIYGRDGDEYLVVAAKGGADEHPSWYRNLQADPQVQVQVGADRFPARARTAAAAERPELWRRMASCWPEFDASQRKTDREIPVVVLERG